MGIFIVEFMEFYYRFRKFIGKPVPCPPGADPRYWGEDDYYLTYLMERWFHFSIFGERGKAVHRRLEAWRRKHLPYRWEFAETFDPRDQIEVHEDGFTITEVVKIWKKPKHIPDQIVVTHLKWDQIDRMFIQTRSVGPVSDDLFMGFRSNHNNDLFVSSRHPHFSILLKVLFKQFPDMNMMQILIAIGCTVHEEFLIWQRPSS